MGNRRNQTRGTGSKQRPRETRIVIVGNCDPVAVSAAMREWLVPMLADQFLAEHHPQSPTYRNSANTGLNVSRKKSTE